jgi:2-haloacid dehalogenase
MDRRTFVTTTAAALGAATLPVMPVDRTAIKVVLFDAFPIFDPRPVSALVNSLFPEQGQALATAWRLRQFEYTWLRTAGQQYRDFWEITGDALASAARSVRVDIAPAQRAMLTDAFLQLQAWPDVPAALQALRGQGLRLGFLSNFTPAMLAANLDSAGLRGQFDYVLSTDQVRSFKPAPASYQLGVAATGLAREQIAFVAFAGWDAVGAKWFGYPTVWVNRLQAAPEELGAAPDAAGPDLQAVLDFVAKS